MLFIPSIHPEWFCGGGFAASMFERDTEPLRGFLTVLENTDRYRRTLSQ
jgi:hypothetical protein